MANRKKAEPRTVTARKKGSKATGRTGASRPAARAKKRNAAAMDHEAMMAEWQKAMTPSAGHRRLEPTVGTWNSKVTMTMDPGAPAQVNEGISENRWVLGGRYLFQEHKGTAMGMPFEGIGYTGYDNCLGKYVGTWMDNFGTGMMTSAGIGKPSSKAIDSEAEFFDPSGKRVKFLCKLRIKDRNHHTYEMWTKAPGGRLFRTLLIEYTRKS